MMTRNERMQTAFNYLRLEGLANNQRNLSEKVGTTPSNVSKALKGDERFLTDKFLRRFNAAFGNVFNEDWLLTGEGEMLRPSASVHQQGGDNATQVGGDYNVNSAAALERALDEIAEQRKLVATAQGQISRLIAVIERMTASAQDKGHLSIQ